MSGIQTNVRLSEVARLNLARLQSHYGTNATATLSFVVAEAVRRLPPPTPFTLPSPEEEDDEPQEPVKAVDGDTRWRRQLLATHTGLNTDDAADLALREALERRSLPEEPDDSFVADAQRRAHSVDSASA